MKVEQVYPAELTSEDIRWLTLACLDSVDDLVPKDLVNSAFDGNTGIFRTVNPDGIFTLTRKGEGLTITGLAGKGYLKNFDTVHKGILTTAAGAGAKFVCGFTTRPGLSKFYKERTPARVAEYFVEDL